MAQNVVIKRLVVVGGSAGSLEVMFQILPHLPTGAGAVYVFVIHRKSDSTSPLASLLQARTALPVREVEDKENLRTDTFFLAPADYHLLLEDRLSFSLDASEKVHYSRPAIDITFESVAQVFGDKTIGVLLSGANADGAEGLKKIADAGGITIAQNPQTADVGYMPQQAVKLGAVQRVEEAENIGVLISSLLKADV